MSSILEKITALADKITDKRLITWKDADQNLCALATYMFKEADSALRTSAPQSAGKSVDGGDILAPGYAHSSQAQPNVGWWSRGWTEETAQNELEFPNPVSSDNVFISAICWYSFQNILKRRLTQARMDICKNLLTQNRRLRWEKKNRSRNEKGRRKHSSKHGRTKER